MRNISFDESTVLREFGRIMSEKGLTKTAADATTPPQPQGLTGTIALPPEAIKAKEQADKQKRDKAIVDSVTNMLKSQPADDEEDKDKKDDEDDEDEKDKEEEDEKEDEDDANVPDMTLGPRPEAPEPPDFMSSSSNELDKAFESLKGKMPQPDINNMLNALKNPDMFSVQAIRPILNKIQDTTMKYPNLLGVVGPKLKELIEKIKTRAGEMPKVPGQKISSRDNKMTKQATDIYDVSGETGEQLIDSAHPGNMHTEITDRKDDDGNLVETIVERQEMDLEVARAIPKGTYASLMGLYEKLNKAGNEEILSELKQAIELVATTDEVFQYQILSLANKLDERGFIAAADAVDVILKKKAAGDPTDIAGNPNDVRVRPPARKSKPNRPAAAATTPKATPTGVEDPASATSYSTPNYSTPEGDVYVPPPATPAQAPAQQPTARPLGKGGTPAVQQWQQKYNARHKLTEGKPGWLKDDGVWGGSTQKAYESEQTKAAPVQTPAEAAKERSMSQQAIWGRFQEAYNARAQSFNMRPITDSQRKNYLEESFRNALTYAEMNNSKGVEKELVSMLDALTLEKKTPQSSPMPPEPRGGIKVPIQ